MKSAVLFAVAGLVAAAAAQTTTASSSSCAASAVLEACLGTENAVFSACGDNDWDCKCYAYADILTCYNNCPNDPDRTQVVGQQQIYCAYASAYPSTTLTATASGSTATGTASSTATGTAATGTAAAAAATTDGTATGTTTTGTATGSAASSSTTANAAAAGRMLGAGSLLAAVAAAVALL